MINSKYTDIYEMILRAAGDPELPEEWELSPQREEVVGPIVDVGQLQDQLDSEFDLDDLLGSGVAVEGSEGEIGEPQALNFYFNPALETNVLIPLRDPITNRQVDIVTSKGCLSQKSIPVLAVADDAHTHEHADACDRRLFVSDGIRDVAILRVLGIPAAPATGLDSLARPLLSRMSSKFGLTRSEAPALWGATQSSLLKLGAELRNGKVGFKPGTLRLTIVACSISDCDVECPPKMAVTISKLRRRLQHLRIDASRIDVWSPQDAEMERLEDLRSFGDPGSLRRALLEGARESSVSLEENRVQSDDYQSIQREYVVAMHGDLTSDNGKKRLRLAADALESFINRRFVGPMREQALQMVDLGLSILALQQSELTTAFMMQSARANALLHGLLDNCSEEKEKEFSRTLHDLLAVGKQQLLLDRQRGGKW